MSSEKTKKNKSIEHPGECTKMMLPVRDTLDVINGKWKLQIIISISHGNKRFTDIEKSIPKITSKVLAKELKDLEQHQLIKRTVYDAYPVVIEYTVTEYSKTLKNLIDEMIKWGMNHRKKIMRKD